jgi:hypothetical protein
MSFRCEHDGIDAGAVVALGMVIVALVRPQRPHASIPIIRWASRPLMESKMREAKKLKTGDRGQFHGDMPNEDNGSLGTVIERDAMAIQRVGA